VLDTTGVITKSSNVGAAMIVPPARPAPSTTTCASFGYGQQHRTAASPANRPACCRAPALERHDQADDVLRLYGLSVTPLQIAQAYAALGNGGKLIAPTFVKGQRNEAHQVMDPEGRARSAAHDGDGDAARRHRDRRRAMLGYHVAGKTGTARKASGGGYSRRYVVVLRRPGAGDNPRFSMVVVINDPAPELAIRRPGVGAGVPHVMDGALRLMDVPPDDSMRGSPRRRKRKRSARPGRRHERAVRCRRADRAAAAATTGALQ
jgi:cell division protein FtsI (penicillin-binding protein 3)